MNTTQTQIQDYLLKQLMKIAEDAVITLQSNKSMQIKYYNNELCGITKWNHHNMEIFANIKKRILITSLKEMTKESADKTIQKIQEYAKHVTPNKEYNGIAKGPFKYKEINETYDKKIADILENQSDRAIEIVNEAIEQALKKGTKRTAGVLELNNTSTRVITSGKVDAEENSTQAYFSIRALLEKEASGHKVACSRTLNKLEHLPAAVEAAELSKQAKNPKHGKAGKYDLVLTPLTFANILDNAGSALSIFSVESGTSCFANQLGKKVASTNLTMNDDATLANGYHSTSFDAEGTPTQKNALIQNGVLKTFLHNTSTTKKYKIKTTANAGLISPNPHNLAVEKGNMAKEEMIQQTKKGLFITNVWYTRFQNYATGDFSTIPRDGCFLIENGKITHPIKNIRISENLINVLKNIDQLGNKPEQVYGWEVGTPTTAPYVLIKNMQITMPE